MEFFIYLQKLLHFSIGLITILNPIAAAAIMISLLQSPSKEEIQSISLKTSLTVLFASLSTVLLGDLILKLFGINVFSIKVIKVIGGIVLLFISISMIKGNVSEAKHSSEESEEAKEKDDISIIPLGIPVLFGPGVIATLIVFKIKSENITDILLLICSVVISALVVYLTLRNASVVNKFLGVTGLKITTRIMGLIVGAIASQFIISGVKHLWVMY